MAALEKAGGNLTYASFVAAVQQIKALNTAMWSSVSFQGRLDGADLGSTWTFTKARHQPENNYWYQSGPSSPLTSR